MVLTTTVALIKFAWAHPLLAAGLVLGLWVGYQYARRRLRIHRALQAARL
jgi:hypothetical protein